jgi:GIY-YIG catalytic domain
MAKSAKPSKPAKKDLPAPDVREFLGMLSAALSAKETADDAAAISDTKWGVYCFYDFDGEPIYVGQTNEKLRVRIRRHLSNQRTDAVGMRVLDPYEILDLEMWPLKQLDGVPGGNQEAKYLLNRLERTIYERALVQSKFGAILNEKIPPDVPTLDDLEIPDPKRFRLVSDWVFEERMHADNRIARRGETLGRLANVVRERGEVSNGLRRVIVIQAARLAWLGAERLAFVEGREAPRLSETIDLAELVGGVQDPDDDDGSYED